MTRIISSTARRTATSTLAAVILASAIPQAASAQTGSPDGVWKIDPTKSQFSARSNTLTIAKAGQTPNLTAKPVIVISSGNVYLATGAAAHATLSSNAFRTVGYTGSGSGKLLLIGTNAHTTNHCGFRCQAGLADDRPMNVTFNAVGASGQQVMDMLAANGQKP